MVDKTKEKECYGPKCISIFLPLPFHILAYNNQRQQNSRVHIKSTSQVPLLLQLVHHDNYTCLQQPNMLGCTISTKKVWKSKSTTPICQIINLFLHVLENKFPILFYFYALVFAHSLVVAGVCYTDINFKWIHLNVLKGG